MDLRTFLFFLLAYGVGLAVYLLLIARPMPVWGAAILSAIPALGVFWLLLRFVGG